MKGVSSALTVLLWLVGGADAAGKSIFKLGTMVDQDQRTVMFLYWAVFSVMIALEAAVHTAHRKITSSSGRSVMRHAIQEVMILGGIAAALIVFENLGGRQMMDSTLFHYVHVVVFLMAILFIALVSSLFVLINYSWRKWSLFEEKLKSIENDPSLTMETRAAFIEKYIRAKSGGDKMASAIIFFETNLPDRFRCVLFSRYMGKMQRKLMLHFLHLDIASWTLLGVLLLLAAIVTGVTNIISSNPLATIGLWVLIIGYGSLFVLIIVFFKIKKEFKLFAIEVQELKQEGLKVPKAKTSSYFWRHDPHFMTRIMQTALVYQVFFLATCFINFIYRLVTSGPWGWIFVIISMGPSVVVFFIMIPIIMPPFTVLASLGELLDHDTLLVMMSADKRSGKYRRQWQRDKFIIAPSPYVAEYGGVLTRERIVEPMMYDESNQNPGCDECGAIEAAAFCQWCGYLCADCDMNYHRLRHNRNHDRKHFAVTEQQIRASAASKIYERMKKNNPLANTSIFHSRLDDSDSSIGPHNESQLEYQNLLMNEKQQEDEEEAKDGKDEEAKGANSDEKDKERKKHRKHKKGKDKDKDKDGDKERQKDRHKDRDKKRKKHKKDDGEGGPDPAVGGPEDV